MRICSYNVNGLRALHSKGALKNLYNKINPDILCLQEIKCGEVFCNIVDDCNPDAYYCSNTNSYSPGYAGVGTISKYKAESMIALSMPVANDEESKYFGGRVVLTKIKPDIAIVNVYTINSGNKDDLRSIWDGEFLTWIQSLMQTHRVIIAGDLNTVLQEHDHWKGLSNVKNQGPGLMQYEYDELMRLINLGFVDSYNYVNPLGTKKSWFSYRGQAYKKGHGWRLDYILVDDRLRDRIKAADIYEDFLGSDHRPITLDIDLWMTNTWLNEATSSTKEVISWDEV